MTEWEKRAAYQQSTNNVNHVLQGCKETGIKKLGETTERLDV